MTRPEYQSRTMSRSPRLTADEIASLKEIANRKRTIPDEHRVRLLKAGYIWELVPPHGGMTALALTGRGLKRLATEN